MQFMPSTHDNYFLTGTASHSSYSSSKLKYLLLGGIRPRQEERRSAIYVHMHADLYPRGLEKRVGFLSAKRKHTILSYLTMAYWAIVFVMFSKLPRPVEGLIVYQCHSLNCDIDKGSCVSILLKN